MRLLFALFIIGSAMAYSAYAIDFDGECSNGTFLIVESIPTNTSLSTTTTTTQCWLDLINSASKTIHMAAFYMTLTGGDSDGQQVYDAIVKACSRGVQVNVSISESSDTYPDVDIFSLATACGSNFDYNFVDVAKLIGGVLHTKFIIADEAHFYVGSANLDWRSLTQVKELGIYVRDCSLMALDLDKVFAVYYILSKSSSVPQHWPNVLSTMYNWENPASIYLNNQKTEAFVSSSPAPFNPYGRTNDLLALQNVIDSATSTLAIEVMDYLPTTLYQEKNAFWPDLDDHIRMANYRGVKVEILIANWTYSIPEMFQYLRSLDQLDNVSVRLMEIPIIQPYTPFTRVNHAKFAVADNIVAICTSNWVGDYFIDTAGVSFVSKSSEVIAGVQTRFTRDWTSIYSYPIGPK